MKQVANRSFRKTRLAPTPSGYLHLGNILSFAITASLARKAGAKTLLRIDDADRERTNKLYVQDIFDTLNFLEIPWDEGPKNMQEYEKQYSQLHRMGMYTKAMQELKESGTVFACTCSRAVLRLNADSIYTGNCRHKNLPLDTENASWRIKTDELGDIAVKTLHGIVKAPLPVSMQYFMVKKRDGFPAYQLTSLMDDLYFGVDLVVRGEDLWPSTLAQLNIASILRKAFMNTTFYHHPLIIDADGNKLSKSEGATSVHYLRKEGKQPADIYAMIAGMPGIEAAPKSWQELVDLYAPDIWVRS